MVPINRCGCLQVIAAYLNGRSVPTDIVRGALWTLWYLLVAEVQLIYRMVHEKSTDRGVLSQEGVSSDISNVAEAARALVEMVCCSCWRLPPFIPCMLDFIIASS